MTSARGGPGPTTPAHQHSLAHPAAGWGVDGLRAAGLWRRARHMPCARSATQTEKTSVLIHCAPKPSRDRGSQERARISDPVIRAARVHRAQERDFRPTRPPAPQAPRGWGSRARDHRPDPSHTLFARGAGGGGSQERASQTRRVHGAFSGPLPALLRRQGAARRGTNGRARQTKRARSDVRSPRSTNFPEMRAPCSALEEALLEEGAA